MRRILEHYFKILGGIDFKSILQKFDGGDKRICASLISWMHAGSHHANEDLYVSVEDATVDAYLRVFKEIFEKCDQTRHYEMMMEKVSQ
jgi:wobble nucleotide-excising tRNase